MIFYFLIMCRLVRTCDNIQLAEFDTNAYRNNDAELNNFHRNLDHRDHRASHPNIKVVFNKEYHYRRDRLSVEQDYT